ncbi:MAG: hypothetical protein ACETVQ_02015, partial [Candidatus Bathyarchaeia archaeon]
MANFVTDSFSVTVGAIIAVWPLVAYHFGIISFVAPLATFLALLALPGTSSSGGRANYLKDVFVYQGDALVRMVALFEREVEA